MSTLNAPDPRQHQTAIWTGTEMIVWGGDNGADALSNGGKYNPSLDNWTPTRPSTRLWLAPITQPFGPRGNSSSGVDLIRVILTLAAGIAHNH